MPRSARRAQLIEVAAGAFLERGFDGTSMEEVAQRAGVSRLIVYRIFESKGDLYRAVLRMMLVDLGEHFIGIDPDELRARGAAHVMMPVARAHPDAFRLLWRHTSNEPEFRDIAVEFDGYVTFFARQILQHFLQDEVLLEWAAHSAGAHLVEGVCNWLDHGSPARDDEFAAMMTAGLRALAAVWVSSGAPASA